MEQFRMVIAITLSLLVFLAWNYFFVDKKAPVLQENATNLPEIMADEKPIPDRAAATIATDARDETASIAPSIEAPVKTVRIDGPLYTLFIDTRGAVFSSFRLKAHKETVAADSIQKELIPENNRKGTVQTGFLGNSVAGFADAVYTTESSTDHIDITDSAVGVSFFWVSQEGVRVEKRFTFKPDSYLIALEILVQNNSMRAIQDRLTVSLENVLPPKNSGYGFEGPAALINGKLEQIKLDSLKDKSLYSGMIGWFTIQDRYFMTSIIPRQPDQSGHQLSLKGDASLSMSWIREEASIAAGEEIRESFDLYFGPKKISILKTFGNGLERAVDFGWFDFIARPCLWIMNRIYSVVPNYGLAIIILTILIKIVLWPLGQKSYSSMNQMKRMQPLMAEIREKYKNDKKRMNEEMMGLYRTYKVNPMGGCLPMIAQIPVFFAFYRMLYEAVELRHAPFMGWINDLSAPDRLFHFNVTIPFMEPPYGIPVLTIIMGATMLIQQKMQPPMGDPAQAKMMMFMPVIFTVIFINFSSGLVLYWLVNNILSIAQQYLVSKKNA